MPARRFANRELYFIIRDLRTEVKDKKLRSVNEWFAQCEFIMYGEKEGREMMPLGKPSIYALSVHDAHHVFGIAESGGGAGGEDFIDAPQVFFG
jgi:hypothetical protein